MKPLGAMAPAASASASSTPAASASACSTPAASASASSTPAASSSASSTPAASAATTSSPPDTKASSPPPPATTTPSSPPPATTTPSSPPPATTTPSPPQPAITTRSSPPAATSPTSPPPATASCGPRLLSSAASHAELACSSTAELTVTDVRLGGGGVGSVTLAAASPLLSFRSAALAVDCASRQLSACYFWDERVDGALFDARRQRVLVWLSRRASLDCFLFDTQPAARRRRFSLPRAPSHAVRRAAWVGRSAAVWLGAPAAAWEAHLLRPAARRAVPLDPSRSLRLNECSLCESGGWLMLHAAAEARAFQLPVPPRARGVALRGEAVCFGAPRGGGAEYFALRQGALWRGALVCGAAQPLARVCVAPWLRGVRGAAELYVACDGEEVCRVWVRREGGVAGRGDGFEFDAEVGAADECALDADGLTRRTGGCFVRHAPSAREGGGGGAGGGGGGGGGEEGAPRAAASRSLHWCGDLKDPPPRAAQDERPPPAALPAFSFATAAREHLSFHPAALLRVLHPSGQWSSASLETVTLLAFGWDRTADQESPHAAASEPSPPHPMPSTSESFPTPSASQPSPPPSTAHPSSLPSASQPSPLPSASQPSPLPSTSQPSPPPSTSQPSPLPSASQPLLAGVRRQDLRGRQDLAALVPLPPALVLTRELRARLHSLLLADSFAQPALLEGEPAGGKTAAVQMCAHLCNAPLLRFNMTPHTTIADFVGQLELQGDTFGFCLGPFAAAVKDGLWLLLDEANLAPDGVLRVIEDVASGGFLRLHSGGIAGNAGSAGGELTVPRHPNFRLFITQNPSNAAAYGATRHALGLSLVSHFVPLGFAPMGAAQMRDITRARLPAAGRQLSGSAAWVDTCADALLSICAATNAAAAEERSAHRATLRDLLQAAELISLGVRAAGRVAVLDGLALIFGQKLRSAAASERIEALVRASARTFAPAAGAAEAERGEAAGLPAGLAVLPEHAALFAALDVAAATRKPLLVCGAHMSGKASAVLCWAAARGVQCEAYALTPDASAEDLFGRWMPAADAAAAARAPFRWEAGPVVRAMRAGRVLLLRGIDAPQPALLEALNALLEADGAVAPLLCGRAVRAARGFRVVCTTRASQHSLTPALASRFLAVRWGGGGGARTSAAGVEALVRSYSRAMRAAEGRADRAAIGGAVAGAFAAERAAAGGEGYPLGRLAVVLRALLHWWRFRTARGGEARGEAARVAAVLARATAAGGGGVRADEWPARLAHVRDGISAQQVFDETGFSLAGGAADDSRLGAVNALTTCVHCRLPLVLEGESGIGKTKVVEAIHRLLYARGPRRAAQLPTIQFSRNTTLQDVAGQFRPQGDSFCWQDGPLYQAMRGGWMLLCDELNLAPFDVISFLVPLLTPPEVFECPFGSGAVRVAPGFLLVAAQNPPHYAGRTALPQSFTCRAVRYCVQQYSVDEVLQILRRRVLAKFGRDSAPEWMTPRLLGLMAVLGYGLAAEPRSAVTLRHVLKLFHRICGEQAWAGFGADGTSRTRRWSDVLRLHANVLFPEMVGAEFRISAIEATLATSTARDGGAQAVFWLKGGGQEASVSLPLRRDAALAQEFARLPRCAKLLLCKLAFCLAFREPALVCGPTCFKSHCVRLLAGSLDFEQTRPLNAVYLSPLTEKGDLEGSIEPHSLHSFVGYARDCCSWLNDQAACAEPTRAAPPVDQQSGPAALRSCLEWHAASAASAPEGSSRRSNAKWAGMLLRELAAFETQSQGFPFCERGVARSVRFGGVLFLKDLDLPDQATTEGLNALTELERSYRSGADPDEPVPVHPQLHIVATVRDGSRATAGSLTRRLSPAIVSRFTLIRVEAPTYADFETEYRALLEQRLGFAGCSHGVDYMFRTLARLERLHPHLVQRLTLSHLLRWCDYIHVRRRLPLESVAGVPGGAQLLNLMLGARVLLLDQLPPAQRAIALQSLCELEREIDPRLATAIGLEEYEIDRRKHDAQFARDSWLFTDEGGVYLSDLRIQLRTEADSVETDLCEMTPSRTFARILSRVLLARDTGHVLNLIGPPGIGKSAIVEVAARMLGRQFVRISCSRCLSVDDLWGSYRPRLDAASGEVVFRYVAGPLTRAIESEGIVLIDEINLAPADVLSVLHGLLSSPPTEGFQTRHRILYRGRTIFACSMNPMSVGGGRTELPAALRELMTSVQLEALDDDEVRHIVHGTFASVFDAAEAAPSAPYTQQIGGADAGAAGALVASTGTSDIATPRKLLDAALAINLCLQEVVPEAKCNLRTLQHLAAVVGAVDWTQAQTERQRRYLQLASLMLVYTAGFEPRPRERAEEHVVAQLFPRMDARQREVVLAHWRRRKVPVSCSGCALRFGPVAGELADGLRRSQRRAEKHDDVWADGVPAPQRAGSYQRLLELASLAADARRIVLLEGPPCSGKTSLVRDLAWLRNERLLTVAVNAETEVTDLIGGFAPRDGRPGEPWLSELNAALNTSLHTPHGASLIGELLACAGDAASTDDDIAVAMVRIMQRHLPASHAAQRRLEALLEEHRLQMQTGRERVPFRIFPGALVVAMQRGYWLLLDNVNSASPEVLERINSVGEADASVHLFELGEGKLTPHPLFRCFATASTRRGSAFTLSEAFRNRCIILHCDPLDWGLVASSEGTSDEVRHASTREALEQLAQSCGCVPDLAKELAQVHQLALRPETPRVGHEEAGVVCGFLVTVRAFHKAAQMAANCHLPIQDVLVHTYGAKAPALASDHQRRIDELRGEVPAVAGRRKVQEPLEAITLEEYLNEHLPGWAAATEWLSGFSDTPSLLKLFVPKEQAQPPPAILDLYDEKQEAAVWCLGSGAGLFSSSLELRHVELCVRPRTADTFCAHCKAELQLTADSNLNDPLLAYQCSLTLDESARVWLLLMETDRRSSLLPLDSTMSVFSKNVTAAVGTLPLVQLVTGWGMRFTSQRVDAPVRWTGVPSATVCFEHGERIVVDAPVGAIEASLRIHKLEFVLALPDPHHGAVGATAMFDAELIVGSISIPLLKQDVHAETRLLFTGQTLTTAALHDIEVFPATLLDCSAALSTIKFEKVAFHVDLAVNPRWKLEMFSDHVWHLPMGLLVTNWVTVLGSNWESDQRRCTMQASLKIREHELCALECRPSAASPTNCIELRLEHVGALWESSTVAWLLGGLPEAFVSALPEPTDPRVHSCSLRLPRQTGELAHLGLELCCASWQLLDALDLHAHSLHLQLRWAQTSCDWWMAQAHIVGHIMGAPFDGSVDVYNCQVSRALAISATSPIALDASFIPLARSMGLHTGLLEELEKSAAHLHAVQLVLQRPLLVRFDGGFGATFYVQLADWTVHERLGLSRCALPLRVERLTLHANKPCDGVITAILHGESRLLGLFVPSLQLELSRNSFSSGDGVHLSLTQSVPICGRLTLGGVLAQLFGCTSTPRLLPIPFICHAARFDVSVTSVQHPRIYGFADLPRGQEGNAYTSECVHMELALSRWPVLAAKCFELTHGCLRIALGHGTLKLSCEYVMDLFRGQYLMLRFYSSFSEHDCMPEALTLVGSAHDVFVPEFVERALGFQWVSSGLPDAIFGSVHCELTAGLRIPGDGPEKGHGVEMGTTAHMDQIAPMEHTAKLDPTAELDAAALPVKLLPPAIHIICAQGDFNLGHWPSLAMLLSIETVQLSVVRTMESRVGAHLAGHLKLGRIVTPEFIMPLHAVGSDHASLRLRIREARFPDQPGLAVKGCEVEDLLPLSLCSPVLGMRFIAMRLDAELCAPTDNVAASRIDASVTGGSTSALSAIYQLVLFGEAISLPSLVAGIALSLNELKLVVNNSSEALTSMITGKLKIFDSAVSFVSPLPKDSSWSVDAIMNLTEESWRYISHTMWKEFLADSEIGPLLSQLGCTDHCYVERICVELDLDGANVQAYSIAVHIAVASLCHGTFPIRSLRVFKSSRRQSASSGAKKIAREDEGPWQVCASLQLFGEDSMTDAMVDLHHMTISAGLQPLLDAQIRELLARIDCHQPRINNLVAEMSLTFCEAVPKFATVQQHLEKILLSFEEEGVVSQADRLACILQTVDPLLQRCKSTGCLPGWTSMAEGSVGILSRAIRSAESLHGVAAEGTLRMVHSWLSRSRFADEEARSEHAALHLFSAGLEMPDARSCVSALWESLNAFPLFDCQSTSMSDTDCREAVQTCAALVHALEQTSEAALEAVKRLHAGSHPLAQQVFASLKRTIETALPQITELGNILPPSAHVQLTHECEQVQECALSLSSIEERLAHAQTTPNAHLRTLRKCVDVARKAIRGLGQRLHDEQFKNSLNRNWHGILLDLDASASELAELRSAGHEFEPSMEAALHMKRILQDLRAATMKAQAVLSVVRRRVSSSVRQIVARISVQVENLRKHEGELGGFLNVWHSLFDSQWCLLTILEGFQKVTTGTDSRVAQVGRMTVSCILDLVNALARHIKSQLHAHPNKTVRVISMGLDFALNYVHSLALARMEHETCTSAVVNINDVQTEPFLGILPDADHLDAALVEAKHFLAGVLELREALVSFLTCVTPANSLRLDFDSLDAYAAKLRKVAAALKSTLPVTLSGEIGTLAGLVKDICDTVLSQLLQVERWRKRGLLPIQVGIRACLARLGLCEHPLEDWSWEFRDGPSFLSVCDFSLDISGPRPEFCIMATMTPTADKDHSSTTDVIIAWRKDAPDTEKSTRSRNDAVHHFQWRCCYAALLQEAVDVHDIGAVLTHFDRVLDALLVPAWYPQLWNHEQSSESLLEQYEHSRCTTVQSHNRRTLLTRALPAQTALFEAIANAEPISREKREAMLRNARKRLSKDIPLQGASRTSFDVAAFGLFTDPKLDMGEGGADATGHEAPTQAIAEDVDGNIEAPSQSCGDGSIEGAQLNAEDILKEISAVAAGNGRREAQAESAPADDRAPREGAQSSPSAIVQQRASHVSDSEEHENEANPTSGATASPAMAQTGDEAVLQETDEVGGTAALSQEAQATLSDVNLDFSPTDDAEITRAAAKVQQDWQTHVVDNLPKQQLDLQQTSSNQSNEDVEQAEREVVEDLVCQLEELVLKPALETSTFCELADLAARGGEVRASAALDLAASPYTILREEFDDKADAFESIVASRLATEAGSITLDLGHTTSPAKELRRMGVEVCLSKLQIPLDQLRREMDGIFLPECESELVSAQNGETLTNSEQRLAEGKFDSSMPDDDQLGTSSPGLNAASNVEAPDARARPSCAHDQTNAHGSASSMKAEVHGMQPDDSSAAADRGFQLGSHALSSELEERRGAARYLAHHLLSRRACQMPTERTIELSRVAALIAIDATLMSGGMPSLAPLLLVVAEAFRICNFATKIIVTGPRELLHPRVAYDSASDASNIARVLQRVFMSATGPSFSSTGPLPDVVLCVGPRSTPNGTPMPLPLAQSARDNFGKSKLGYVALGENGQIDVKLWAPTSGLVEPVASLEILLSHLQPPRAVPIWSSWHNAWCKWSDFPKEIGEMSTLLNTLVNTLLDCGRGLSVVESQVVLGEDKEHVGCHDMSHLLMDVSVFRARLHTSQEMKDGSVFAASEKLWSHLESADWIAQRVDAAILGLSSMPPNAFSQSSGSSQGKVLYIPGLIKRYLLQGNYTAIWQQKNRGPQRKLCVCLVLDLTPSHCGNSDLLQSVFVLLTALQRVRYHTQLVCYTLHGVWVVHTEGDWGHASWNRLLILFASSAQPQGRGSCHIVSGVLLGLQLLLAAPVAATSPRMLWLLTSGAPDACVESLADVYTLATSRNVDFFALSPLGADLSALGVPRWRSCWSDALPQLLQSVFNDEFKPSYNQESQPEWIKEALEPLSQTPLVGLEARKIAEGGTQATARADEPRLEYLSGALDYFRDDESENGSGEQPLLSFDVSEEEVAMFLRKVSTSVEEVRAATKLLWRNKGLTARDGEVLAHILSTERLLHLEHLSLEKNRIGDSGLCAISQALRGGALRNLTRFILTDNAIGDDGMAAFMWSLSCGAAPRLQWLYLNNNRIGDVGLKSFAAALRQTKLPELQMLWLHENQITDDGILALVDPICSGALERLNTLSLDHNPIGSQGISALVKIISANALPSCKTILLGDNSASKFSIRAVADALKKRMR